MVSFRDRYRQELAEQGAELARLQKVVHKRKLVLLFAAKSREHNHALALREVLEAER